MTNKINEIHPIEMFKSSQHLTAKQKVLFAIFSCGVQSWGQANNFETLGYDQKHKDAKKAMYIGLFIYGLAITLFLMFLLLKKG